MKEFKVICTKTFTSNTYGAYGSTFLKNFNYILIDYDYQDTLYISVPDDNGPFAAYPISKKYRENFKTLKEIRKQKLENLKKIKYEKLNENR